ncbi:hypothetical protein C455_01327 [Haloferax larsenii JCM 13917]|nr:hypothetical protein C455_01327 [Haloferax larsenii JCM 13917]
MASSSSEPMSRCRKCGYSAVSGGTEWSRVESSLGTMTQCPECGSTDVMTGL